MSTSWLECYSSTATHHLNGIDSHRYRSSLDSRYRICCQLTPKLLLPEWQASAEETEEHATTPTEQVEYYYNQHAQPLPEIHAGSNVAIQNTTTKLWDIYGVVTAIGLTDTTSRLTVAVLVRNHRYLHCHITLPPPGAIVEAPQPPQGTNSDPSPPT